MLNVKIKKSIPGFDLNVNFSINREILAILGPSGSGKTITLKCIAGLLNPDEGSIELNGRVLFDSSKKIDMACRQRKIGFVFQNYALFPHLSVYENTAYGIRHLKKEERKKRVSWLLDKMHIAGLSQRLPKELSSGQQQRVALARALCNEPELLLLDEPFSALDTPRRERLERELLSMQDFYKGDILFVTHDLAQGYKLGSKIAIYESGQMVQCDGKYNVISCPNNLTVARLTGLKNLISGNIVEAEGNDLQVTVPELRQTFRANNNSTADLPIDSHVILGIRPEHIEIVGHQGENTVIATATQVVDGVANKNCYFRVTTARLKKDIEVIVTKSAPLDIVVGHQYNLYLPPERLILTRQ